MPDIDLTEMIEGLEIKNPEIKGRNGIIVFLAAAGANQTEIANKLGMTQASIGLILRSPIVQEEMKRITDEIGRQLVHHRLLALSHTALSTVVHLMHHAESETVKLRSAQDILDRAKFNRTMKEEEDSDVPIRDLIRRLDELAKKESEREDMEARTVDVTPVHA